MGLTRSSNDQGLRLYGVLSPLGGVLRNTSKDFAVVDGIAAMAENAGALSDVF